jgi:hypothetical protein
MNSIQIEHILSHALRTTGTKFLGVFPSDRLPTPTTFPACFVANTDPHSERGSHWVAFYYDSPDHLDFFDSYGMPLQFYDFPSFIIPRVLRCSNEEFQSLNSDVCGHYCIYFLARRSRRQTLSSILQTLRKCGACTDRSVKHFVLDLVDSDYQRLPSLSTYQSCRPRRA